MTVNKANKQFGLAAMFFYIFYETTKNYSIYFTFIYLAIFASGEGYQIRCVEQQHIQEHLTYQMTTIMDGNIFFTI